jgi:cyclic pyranopterin phosphate synthase
MLDLFNRNINYLRISVTDRCNLRCNYCMPEEGVELMHHKDILSFEEIQEIVRICAGMGVDKVRITGGEPLVRRGIVDLVKMLSAIQGIKDLSMTTNGTLLEHFAIPLAKAGLQRVNISLDTLKFENYGNITRVGDISNVMSGIEAAVEAGLTPIKINCVIKKSRDETDAREVDAFCRERGFQVRFIKEMNLRSGVFSTVIGGDGGNCKSCNRLRLTANGKIKPCLFSDLEFDVRELGIEQAIIRAIGKKPESGTENLVNSFSNIGG